MIYDLIIVGAGLTGLCAARTLLKTGHENISFKILEARDRVGGRTQNQHFQLGSHSTVVDIGGQWIGPSQNNVLNLIQELEGLELVEQTWVTKKSGAGEPGLYEVLRRKPLTLEENQEVIEINRRLEQMALLLTVEEPFKCEQANKWDLISIGEYFRQNVKYENARQELELEVVSLTACSADKLSLLYWLIFLRSIPGGYTSLDDGVNGAQHYKLTTGAQNISVLLAQQLARKYGQDCIEYEQPVQTVNYEEDTVIRVITANREYSCRRLLLAFAHTLLLQIQFSPKLPKIYQELSSSMIMGQCIKTIFIYNQAFWRINNVTNEELSSEQALEGPCYNLFEAPLHNDTHHALIGLIVGDLASKWSKRPEEDLIQAITTQYQRLYSCPDAIPIKTCIQYWPNEIYSGGCYAGTFPPKVLTKYHHLLRKPIIDERIWCASTETALQWIGYMEGAIQAGEAIYKQISQTIR
ncbi:unnamed protein product [Didymodactylos carnosus]|uniref:Amine oxidase n=1 Tax=Didymodactylos carnosus TaxID=1234261 RepID=A0A815ATV0_9BILA|nr:unnamed protein product [Didymodactylos carnosus]CAF1261484.1 unnamed protein product [Didymodactylos carnosus]CAF3809076.1 unnamed protein product [Didymodactylos carnosus]CAF4039553.1 unnamed protein product [Didymodactylos carnosus]